MGMSRDARGPLLGDCDAGMISSVNSDFRRNVRRRYRQISSWMAGRVAGDWGITVYFPNASVGPGFFQVLSV